MKRPVFLLAFVLFLVVIAAGCKEDDSPAAPAGAADDSPSIKRALPPGGSPGIQLTITGRNFGGEQDTGSVHVAGKDAAVLSWADTEVEFTMPDGLSNTGGTADVVLTTGAGETASVQIEVTPPHTYKVTANSASNQQPCWSPDGNWIYFSSTLSGNANWDIYRIPAMGGDEERITYADEPDFNPDVRPSSGEVAWTSRMKHLNNTELDYEIFYGFPLCPQPGSGCSVTMLTDNDSRDLDPAYANTVYAGYDMVYSHEVLNPGGGLSTWEVTLNGGGGPEPLTGGRQPNFSSDGRWVVYNFDDNIYKIPTDGGSPVQLTSTGGDFYPHWGWANDKIVFERFNGGNGQDIFVMDSDGSNVQPLVSTRNDEHCPSWSPDGTKVAYHALVSGHYHIYVYVVP